MNFRDSSSWKMSLLYRMAKVLVLVGVLGELIGDAGVFGTSGRLQNIEEYAISAAGTKASEANLRAGSLEKEAATMRERAAVAETKLPSERRLTAKERWHLGWIESSRASANAAANCPACFGRGPQEWPFPAHKHCDRPAMGALRIWIAIADCVGPCRYSCKRD